MEKDNIKTIRDFMMPQFTLLASPEQDEIIRQREQEAEREHEKELQAKKKLEFNIAEFRSVIGMNLLKPGRHEMQMMKNAFRQSSSIRIRKTMIRFFFCLDQRVWVKLILVLRLSEMQAALLFRLKK